jgi:AcrR family transcriptional regulator
VVKKRGDGEGDAERPEFGPLSGGRHGLSREVVLESRRERLLSATVHDVATRGYRAATLTEIVGLASVSTRGFYEHFATKEDAFLAAFEAILAHLEDLIAAAAARHPDDWPGQVVAALGAALDFFASDPDLARFCLVEPVAATVKIAIRFRDAVLSAIPYLARGRAEKTNGGSLPGSTEDSLIGGAVSLASRSVILGESASLRDLLPDLVDFLLTPYLGSTRAQELAAAASRST